MTATVSPAALGATEAVSIALAVFVMLTAFLMLILVLLCASKSFRAFFFREGAKKKKAAEKKANKPAVSPPAASETSPIIEPELVSAPSYRGRRSKKSGGLYDGVPTVPLDVRATERSKPSDKRAPSAGVRTVELPRTVGNTYTPRTTAIARGKIKSAPPPPDGGAETPAETKKITRRADSVRSAQKDEKK